MKEHMKSAWLVLDPTCRMPRDWLHAGTAIPDPCKRESTDARQPRTLKDRQLLYSSR